MNYFSDSLCLNMFSFSTDLARVLLQAAVLALAQAPQVGLAPLVLVDLVPQALAPPHPQAPQVLRVPAADAIPTGVVHPQSKSLNTRQYYCRSHRVLY